MSNHSKFRRYVYSVLAAEISCITKYADRVIQWLPTRNDDFTLLDMIVNSSKTVITDENLSDVSNDTYQKTIFLINGTINHNYDIQGLLLNLHSRISRASRVIIIAYNPYVSWLYRLANKLELRRGELPTTFVTRVDLENIAKISNFCIVKTRFAAYFPWRMFGLGSLINRLMPSVPLLKWLGFAYIAVLRPIIPENYRQPSLSCVIPARNERGNIENAIKRMPDLGCELEVIFVEGHSNDGTWEEIQRVKEIYQNKISIRAFQQTGKGKSDAVRLGFSKAKNDLLTILDADLTMPPEMLGRFYQAYCAGHGDFINGSRLVYPMQGEAMRYLNRLGNIFFAKALSWVLDERIGDSLCGTKLITRSDYDKMISWRADFGDFDPFGDFELLFPAAVMGLGIVDVPIRYLDRTYGSTNISRFRHGMMLLRMTIIGFFKLKIGAGIDKP
ncbi:MAG: glycosyltransferase family 2 protein [Smithella sp.]|jgi:hypothetical protein